jgi:hypothetical protein
MKTLTNKQFNMRFESTLAKLARLTQNGGPPNGKPGMPGPQR